MTTRSRIPWAAAALALAPGSGLWAGEAPDWLLRAARAELPAFDAKVPGVVLVDDARLVVDEDGDQTESLTFAVKILSRPGRRLAVARAVYATDLDKVKELEAWLVHPSGAVKHFGRGETLDVALLDNSVYAEGRARILGAADEVQVGDVFGFVSVVERRTLFNQLEWSFQSRPLPVRSSRCEVVLPPGWKLAGTMINRPPLEPQVNGASWVWELRDLPFIEDEPASPELSSLTPRLAVNLTAPEGVKNSPPGFDTWVAVSRWTSGISDPRAQPTDALVAKARELTQGLSDERERIRAIGRFVQKVAYISIQVGLGRFQPHAATEVLAKSYGDCKDKVNLMRALLATQGITSYPVLVCASDRDYVRREWPSPQQFDHVIIAIKTPSAKGSPAAVEHPTLGPLLLFDPTDDDTLLGDLPRREQGGPGLLAAGDQGILLTVPTIAVDSNRLVRETSAVLTPAGGLTARIVEAASGQAGAHERRVWCDHPHADYVTLIEKWLAAGISGAKAERVEARDDEQGSFRLEVELSAERYGQTMQGRLLIFKPALVARREGVLLTDSRRTLPVVLGGSAYSESARIKLPPGFVVDELPSPVKVVAPFGSYELGVVAQGEEVVLTRHLATQPAVIPVEQYAAVRSFFEKIMAAEQAPVVLIKR